MTARWDQITKEQLRALMKLWARQEDKHGESLKAFIRRAQKEPCGDALMIEWCGMWIGVERDGYTHS